MIGLIRGEVQPNVKGQERLPPRFWILTVLTGVVAGLGAIAMMETLRTVQHLAFHYHSGEFSAAVARVSDVRRLVMLTVGGLVTGLGLWALTRYLGGTGGEPTQVVWTRSGHLSFGRTMLSGALSEMTVGFGGSIGREAAPQRFGAAGGSFIARTFRLTPDQTYVLIACGAGAGLAAVYNSPLAGALMAVELYLGAISLNLLLPALLASGVATAVSWLVLPARAVYNVPALPSPTLALIGFAILIGPLIGIASAGYVALIGWASDHRPHGRLLILEPVLFFMILGVLAFRYPLLLGNGLDLAQFAFTGSAPLLVFAVLALLKPLATAGTLRSGASGGLFTPTMSFGAVLGVSLGRLWSFWLPGSPDATYGVLAAAAMMGAAMDAPATAVVFIMELTNRLLGVMVPALLAVVGATVTARYIDHRSIYSARLAPEPTPADAARTQERRS